MTVAHQSLSWNPNTKLIFSDVDETIADVYTPAEPEMINELQRLLQDNYRLCMVTGGSLKRVMTGITDLLQPDVRQHILVSHCSGAEVWGFTSDGSVKDSPFYSLYEERVTEAARKQWRQIMQQLLDEFSLRPHPAQPKSIFWETVGKDPFDIMYDDRGPQITLEVVNATDLPEELVATLPYSVPHPLGRYDLRNAIKTRAETLLQQHNIPITPRFGGNFALDFAIAEVSKTTSITHIMNSTDILESIGLTPQDLKHPNTMEVWGDKFSMIHGGTDRHISEALPPEVRSIDFRQEDPAEFLPDYNMVIWDGDATLHHGLLEYLQTRTR